MPKAVYKDVSPWKMTPINNNYLGYFKIRPLIVESDDTLYSIEPQYTYRPDLLAYDLYGEAKLWWVFTQRNLDVLSDPIFDFVPGVKIFLPKIQNIKSSLGL
jgi:Base plate wedge protein 53